jgi:hypothetical protein
MRDVRWWTLAELESTQDLVRPPGLPDLIRSILAGQVPERPVTLGR